jgi:hypothetical protein
MKRLAAAFAVFDVAIVRNPLGRLRTLRIVLCSYSARVETRNGEYHEAKQGREL